MSEEENETESVQSDPDENAEPDNLAVISHFETEGVQFQIEFYEGDVIYFIGDVEVDREDYLAILESIKLQRACRP